MSIISIFVIAIICFSIYYKLNINKKKPIMSFKASNDLVGLPIITFYNNKRKLHFLLDTGADRSAFSKYHLHIIEHKLLNTQDTIVDAGGHTTDVACAEIKLYYENNSYEGLFNLMDMSHVSEAIDLKVKGRRVEILGIIGDDFLTKYKYILDFQKMIAYSR